MNDKIEESINRIFKLINLKNYTTLMAVFARTPSETSTKIGVNDFENF